MQPRNRPGHANRQVAEMMSLKRVLIVLKPHRCRRARGRNLAEIIRNRVARRGPVYEKSAATDVSCGWMRDGKREGCGHSGINRRSAVLQRVNTHLRRDGVL